MNSLIVKRLLAHPMYGKCPYGFLKTVQLPCDHVTPKSQCGKTRDCWLKYFMASITHKYINQSISLELPWPVTVNRYMDGNYHESKESKQYKNTVATIVAKTVSYVRITGKLETPFTGCVRIVGLACPPDRRKRDMNNIYKVLYDALVYSKLIADDSIIKYDEWSEHRGGSAGVFIDVEELRETPQMEKWTNMAEEQRAINGEAVSDLIDAACEAEELGVISDDGIR